MIGSIKGTLEAICKKHNFALGNYYAVKGDEVTCAGQDFYIADAKMSKFQSESTKYPFKKGSGLPGRVWDSKGHEWCSNVQKLDPSKYARRQLAIDTGVKACIGVAHTEGGVVKGIMEFFLFDEKAEDGSVVSDVKGQIQK